MRWKSRRSWCALLQLLLRQCVIYRSQRSLTATAGAKKGGPRPSSFPPPFLTPVVVCVRGVLEPKAAETRDRLSKNLIDLYIGRAEILPDSKRERGEKGEIAVRVCRPRACIDIPAHHVCIATGSR